MKMRIPAVPLVAVDPFFSIWSMEDNLAGNDTLHWTGVPQQMTGSVTVDGTECLFMGKGDGKVLKQTMLDMDLFSSVYVFEGDGFKFTVKFTSPLFPEDLRLLSRPVSYINTKIEFYDNSSHNCNIKLCINDAVCLDKKFDSPTVYKTGNSSDFVYASLENSVQKPLSQSGDDMRISWGALYLATKNKDAVFTCITDKNTEGRESNTIQLQMPLCLEQTVALAYDDIKSLEYFGKHLDGYWKSYYSDIFEAVSDALNEYDDLIIRCENRSKSEIERANKVGGEKYAELVTLAFRQTLAAHKTAKLDNNELLFISKECFSDGDAATVDVTYPSCPMMLLYNPALLKGMLLPIYTLAESDSWNYDCAPHDMGIYPILNGQEYKDENGNVKNMPVEECGNMIILTAAYVKASGDYEFAKRYSTVIKQWVKYLIENGEDPENQLCTDDFAGPSAHNCNLTVKAIMGVASCGLIFGMLGDKAIEVEYLSKAKEMAQSWEKRAKKSDGSYKMTFDLQDSFSLKYNAVWDIAFGTSLFDAQGLQNEIKSYTYKQNEYGVPLDNRANYSKSDWILWCASMSEDKDVFTSLVEPVWKAYDKTETRCPMGDWYDTKDAKMIMFRNRTVQGAMFMPILLDDNKLQFDK